MKIVMWIRPDQLVRYQKDESAYASTFRDNDSCFQIEISIDQVDVIRQEKGLPTNNYYIKPLEFTFEGF